MLEVIGVLGRCIGVSFVGAVIDPEILVTSAPRYSPQIVALTAARTLWRVVRLFQYVLLFEASWHGCGGKQQGSQLHLIALEDHGVNLTGIGGCT